MKIRISAGVAAAVALTGCNPNPAAPPNMPPQIPISELITDSDLPYASEIVTDGDAVLAQAPVDVGGVLATIPFRYRHTALLAEDLRGFSITVRGVRAPAGAPGYYAGSFNSFGGYNSSSGLQDLWCFFRGVGAAGAEREPTCLLRDDSGIAAIAPTSRNQYLWTGFAPSGSFDYVHTPIFERRAVEMPVDLAVEYIFDGWDDGKAKVKTRIRGKEAPRPSFESNEANRAVLRTIGGKYVIEREPTNPDGAVILPQN